MLNVLTLWIVFVVDFLALGAVWAYVSRSYPNFHAARFWMFAAFLAAAGGAVSILRDFVALPLIPLLTAGVLVISSASCIAMGIERFYGLPVSWRTQASMIAVAFAGMGLFICLQMALMRVLVFSICLSVVIAITVRHVLGRPGTVRDPGARLAGIGGILLIVTIAVRAVTMAFSVGGDASLLHFTKLQAAIVLVQVFLSMAWNFGFLLMAIDRLRAEVAGLALIDDLTGIANRRHFLQRLSEECARSNRTLEPFVLLLIDLDYFKSINDTYGHGAGDACLRLFSCNLQGRLRTGDLLARMGGDEFCAVLPSTTLREGELVASHLIEACRNSMMHWNGKPIPLSASIGVAQWRVEMGEVPEKLIVEADQALYMAKHGGRNRYMIYDSQGPEGQSPLLKMA